MILNVRVAVPQEEAAALREAIENRLSLTHSCVNPWHKSAPARRLELCPECVDSLKT